MIMMMRRKSSVRRKREPNYVADMDKVFQYYVRLRDSMPGGYCRCISCGRLKPFDQIQAGHFWSRRNMSVRWSEQNVNGECIFCNIYDGDHLLGYRENLIKKIGLRSFELLDVEHHMSRKWSDFEIIELIKHYGEEVVRLSASKAIPISQEVMRIIKKYAKK